MLYPHNLQKNQNTLPSLLVSLLHILFHTNGNGTSLPIFSQNQTGINDFRADSDDEDSHITGPSEGPKFNNIVK